MKKTEDVIRIDQPKKVSCPRNKKSGNVFLDTVFWFLESLLFLWDMGKTLIIVIAIAFVIRFYLIQPFYVEGQSMEPNFNNGEYLLIDEISYHFRAPQRGEVIVFRPPVNTYQNYIKRIIALPGESIFFKDTGYTMNNDKHPQGFTLEEPYLAPGTIVQGNGEYDIQDAQFFVMGDNRTASSDSRSFGPINKKNITGRVWFYIKTEPWKTIPIFGTKIVIPKVKSMGKINNPSYTVDQ